MREGDDTRQREEACNKHGHERGFARLDRGLASLTTRKACLTTAALPRRTSMDGMAGLGRT